jgi:hypothetical protein
MYKLILIILLIIVIIIFNKSPQNKKEEPPIINKSNIKYIIISKESCPACIKYKSNHNYIVEQLKKKYPNIEIELIENDKKNNLYNIKFYPTFIIEKNDKMLKLPMNTPASFENLDILINKL